MKSIIGSFVDLILHLHVGANEEEGERRPLTPVGFSSRLTRQERYERHRLYMRRLAHENLPEMSAIVKRNVWNAVGAITVLAAVFSLGLVFPWVLKLAAIAGLCGLGVFTYLNPDGRWRREPVLSRFFEIAGSGMIIFALASLAKLMGIYPMAVASIGVAVASWLFARKHYPEVLFSSAESFAGWSIRMVIKAMETTLIVVHRLGHCESSDGSLVGASPPK